MIKQFHFEVLTEWQKGIHKNPKSHASKIEGKVDLDISAAREFKGEKDKHNPEDLLLSSLSSCHMMSYFYVCQQNGIDIIDYIDNAVGTLDLKEDASGGFSEVILNPKVKLEDNTQKSLAISLHEKAHELCFIANSVNFKIIINPSVIS